MFCAGHKDKCHKQNGITASPKGHILYDSIYIKCPNLANLQGQKEGQ